MEWDQGLKKYASKLWIKEVCQQMKDLANYI